MDPEMSDPLNLTSSEYHKWDSSHYTSIQEIFCWSVSV